MTRHISQDEILSRRDALPVFPRVIDEILQSLDDPDANINLLVSHVGRDPVLAARVFALANSAASNTRRNTKIRDLYTATSLIGLTRLRDMAIVSSLTGFLQGALPPGLAPGFWEHSAATGICAQQLALQTHHATDAALIAGLLHDVGQLWLARFEAEAFHAAYQISVARTATIDIAERERFGTDHTEIGGWLAESWGLPKPIVEAIRWHHAPDTALHEALVAVVHVAEVLSNALDLGRSENAHVSYLSPHACKLLDLKWDESAEVLFGRIDGMSQFVTHFYRKPATPPGTEP